MTRFLLHRLIYFTLALWLLTVFSFLLNWLFPGDVITNMSGIRAISDSYASEFALRGGDDNLVMQYIYYLQNLINFDWGYSLVSQQPVWLEASRTFMATAEILLLALLLALVVGLPLGALAAMRYHSGVDKTIVSIAVGGYSIPVFWLAQLLILLFAVKLRWLPITGQIDPLFLIEPQSGSVLLDIALSDSAHKAAAYRDALAHMVLPVIVLASLPAMLLLRMMRNTTVEVMQQPYIKAVRARGLSPLRVAVKHAIPNAIQGILQQLTFIFGLMLANAVIVESIFNWPGIGSWLLKAIIDRDYPVIQAALLILVATTLFANLLFELYRGWRFPIVREERYGAT
jgi:ABC-type dipeptide/oligopeptide/nickel transport system permease component